VSAARPIPDTQAESPPDHAICPTCRRPIDLTRYCADCSAPFMLTMKDQQFFAARKLALPRRCPECRAARKRLRLKGV
jgi:predicted amidophosphoribosyltransferase